MIFHGKTPWKDPEVCLLGSKGPLKPNQRLSLNIVYPQTLVRLYFNQRHWLKYTPTKQSVVRLYFNHQVYFSCYTYI